jgi:hypothetical protein
LGFRHLLPIENRWTVARPRPLRSRSLIAT